MAWRSLLSWAQRCVSSPVEPRPAGRSAAGLSCLVFA